MSIPVLLTPRLILRGVTEADAPAYEGHFADWEVIGQLGAAVPWPYPPDGARDFIRHSIVPEQGKDNWLWGIFRKVRPTELIGAVHLWRQGCPEHRGFWLGRRFWGQGYMTEATEAVMDCAFGQLGFEKLTFANALGNVRSRRIKEKTGARLVRTEPRKYVNPAYSETEIWELTKAEWTTWKTRPDRCG
jgi:[ribosomal protein S5]-alanine N-acetyltransferase